MERYKLEHEIEVKPKRKHRVVTLFSLTSSLIILLGLHSYYIKPQNDVATAAQKVADLFIDADEGNTSKIKESTDQEQIDKAVEAINKIGTSKGKNDEYSMIAMSLDTSVIFAQKQLDKRKGNQTSDVTEKKKEYKYDRNLSSVENLLENFPDLQDDFDEIPEENKKRIKVPALKDIPFTIDKVIIEQGSLNEASVFYYGDNKNKSIKSSVWEFTEEISKEAESVQLNENITGYFHDYRYSDSITIHWRDPEEESQVIYGIWLNSSDKQFTKDDLTKLAKSMID